MLPGFLARQVGYLGSGLGFRDPSPEARTHLASWVAGVACRLCRGAFLYILHSDLFSAPNLGHSWTAISTPLSKAIASIPGPYI